jgi:hypothetical protein
MHAGTIASRHCPAHVWTLTRSFQRHNPAVRFTAFVIHCARSLDQRLREPRRLVARLRQRPRAS